MKNNSCLIAVTLDRSGSMQLCKDDTIGGFNSFLEQQQKLSGECLISLYQFDDIYEKVYERMDIKSAPKLTDKTFIPRNSTALLDAMGKTINNVGIQLAAMKEEDRPSRIILVTVTDGMENASREFTREKVFEMIIHQREKYSWVFVFLGAGQDAIAVGQSYGISPTTSMTYSTNNTHAVFNSTNYLMSGMRCASVADFHNIGYSDKDRESAVKQ